jgi:hypothetical protein
MSGKRADAHNESLNSRIEGIHGVMNAMGAYIGDTMLTGNAYSRSKQHMSQFYRPMYTGLMNCSM